MKTAKIQKIVKTHLLPELEGFRVTGRLLYAAPLHLVLRGFYFDDSSFSPSTLYPWVFVQPLYVPRSEIHFTFGKRLRNQVGDRVYTAWEFEDPVDPDHLVSLRRAIREHGLVFLSRITSPQELADNLENILDLRENLFVEEAVAYSLAYVGNYAEALRRLDKLQRSVKPDDPWAHVGQRAIVLSEAVEKGRVATAELLEQWADETARRLKVSRDSTAKVA